MDWFEADPLKDTFKRYYEKYHQAVYRRFLRRLSRYPHAMKREQAEDFLQDTFFGLFRWMQKYWEEHHCLPPAESAERVLYRIEINKYVNYYHKHLKPAGDLSRRPANGSRLYPEGAAALEPRVPDYQRPDQRLLQEELLARVTDCIENQLEPYQRAALLCRAMGYSYKDIAVILGEDEATVAYSILPLARKKLKKCMGDYAYGQRKR